MTEQDIRKRRGEIALHIGRGRLHEAFEAFGALLGSCPNWGVSEKLAGLQTSYKYMLMYMAQGSADPQREQVYGQLVTSLYQLLDDYCQQLLSLYSRSQRCALRKDFATQGVTLQSLLNAYRGEQQKCDLFAEAASDDTGSNAIELHRNAEKAANRMFNYVWTAARMSGDDLDCLAGIIKGGGADSVPDGVKELLLSAILLNINDFYNERLLLLLFDAYRTHRDNNDVAMRALCSIFLALRKHSQEARLSEAVNGQIADLKEDSKFCTSMESIALQFVRSCDTDQLTRKVRDELLPDIMKAGSSMMKNFKKGPQDSAEIEMNPEWEEMIAKTGFTDKMKEFNEIQMEGGDVFMGTFSRLKSYPFFGEVANWFVPFSPTHSVVLSTPVAGNKVIGHIISQASFLCDSDRYSFCLSMNSIPQSQRDMMLSQFDAQGEMLDELKRNIVPAPKIDVKRTITTYLQDLYRFFKLYSQRGEFESPFTGSILDATLLADIICTPDNLSLVAEYYLKDKQYGLALSYFKQMPDNQPSTLQKIAFCHQNLKQYGEAIEYYLKYDLFDSSNLWNTRHLAACYRAAGNVERALDYYQRAETLAPDNLNTGLNIGHCLLELNRIDEALKYYYKVDYLCQSAAKTMRPIAWCLFLQGNLDQSEEYYKKIIAQGATAEDMINYGHLLMARNDTRRAVEAYKKSIEMAGGDFARFSESFTADAHYLLEKGVKERDMALILDIIHYNL